MTSRTDGDLEGADTDDSAVPDQPEVSVPVPGRWDSGRAVRWVAAIMVLAAGAVAGYEGWLLYRQHQADVAAAQALNTAKTYAVTLTSIDTKSLDQNFSAVLDGATGEFKDMYAKSSTQLHQLLADNKASAHGTVVDAAIRSATIDKVEVLLFVDQSVSNLAVPDPRIDRSRIKMTMEKVDGRWLAGKVELP